MPKTKWTINSQGPGRDATDLDGCIVETIDGGGYSLSSPHPNSTELSTAPAGTPPLAFTSFTFDGWTWDLSINSIATSQLSGSWSNNDPSITEEAGSWAADVGADQEDVGADQDEVDADQAEVGADQADVCGDQEAKATAM
jgi:hypothetical protein